MGWGTGTAGVWKRVIVMASVSVSRGTEIDGMVAGIGIGSL